MSKGPSNFKMTDAKRLVQTIKGAGEKIERVERERGGKIVAYLADDAEPEKKSAEIIL
jgi:hypothetical protein